jgi:hypothetical protein
MYKILRKAMKQTRFIWEQHAQIYISNRNNSKIIYQLFKTFTNKNFKEIIVKNKQINNIKYLNNKY